MSYKYLHVESSVESWENLLLSADSDFINYLISAYYELDMATALWQSAQAAEKYMKSLLKKNEYEIPTGREGHNLKTLWDLVKQEFSSETHLFSEEKDYDRFIDELSTANPNTRYSFSIQIEAILFIRKFMEFCDDLRRLILGQATYSSRGFVGLPKAFLNEKVLSIIRPIISTSGSSLRL